MRYAFFLCLRSEYDEAVGVADRGIELATQVRDSFDFLLGHFFRAWALLHAGRWGEMQRELDGASRLAERNGHDLWALLFDIERAWLYLEAHARERAVELAQRCLAKARALEHIVTERFSQLVLGRALAALGRGDESAEHLSVFRDREAAREPYLMGWILAMPGELACARLAIEREDADAAIAGAERLARMARVSNEETYVASAELERARGAHLAGDASAAGGHLQCALELVESRPLPLAEWRVHSYAAERAKGARRTAHRRQAKRASERLRASLDEGDPLADALDERIALLGERSGSTQ